MVDCWCAGDTFFVVQKCVCMLQSIRVPTGGTLTEDVSVPKLLLETGETGMIGIVNGGGGKELGENKFLFFGVGSGGVAIEIRVE